MCIEQARCLGYDPFSVRLTPGADCANHWNIVGSAGNHGCCVGAPHGIGAVQAKRSVDVTVFGDPERAGSFGLMQSEADTAESHEKASMVRSTRASGSAVGRRNHSVCQGASRLQRGLCRAVFPIFGGPVVYGVTGVAKG